MKKDNYLNRSDTILELDKSIFGKCRCHRENIIGGVWVSVIAERITNHITIFFVPNRYSLLVDKLIFKFFKLRICFLCKSLKRI